MENYKLLSAWNIAYYFMRTHIKRTRPTWRVRKDFLMVGAVELRSERWALPGQERWEAPFSKGEQCVKKLCGEMEHHGLEQSFLTGNIWPGLEVFWIQNQEGMCYWHLVSKGQRSCLHPVKNGTVLHIKNYPIRVSIGLKLGVLLLKHFFCFNNKYILQYNPLNKHTE